MDEVIPGFNGGGSCYTYFCKATVGWISVNPRCLRVRQLNLCCLKTVLSAACERKEALQKKKIKKQQS